MRVIIAGSRGITDILEVDAAVATSGFEVTEVVCGMARGVDLLGRDWAKMHGHPVAKFPADWDRYGKSAGYIRNSAMARYADALVAVWDCKSRGTSNMIDLMIGAQKPVFIRRVE